jgi:hypothetical protein
MRQACGDASAFTDRKLDFGGDRAGRITVTTTDRKTVGRKRQKLEKSGLLRYRASVDLSPEGTGKFLASHLYIVKFSIGVTYDQIRANITRGADALTLTAIIADSQIAEIDGKLALLFVVEGTSDRDIVKSVHEQLIPSLVKNHGPNAILEINTLRLLGPVRILRNYLPTVNMDGPTMKPAWPDSSICVGD